MNGFIGETANVVASFSGEMATSAQARNSSCGPQPGAVESFEQVPQLFPRGGMDINTRLYKNYFFFALPIFLFESFAQTKWTKNQQIFYEKLPKKEKIGKFCIFAFKNPNLAQTMKNFTRPYGCMVAAFRNSD